jgi:long-chain acyl-CoA synthetase
VIEADDRRVVQEVDLPFVNGLTIRDGIRSVAARDPRAPAVECDGRHLNFGALADRIERVATLARHGLGLGRGDHAAIFSPNRLEYVEVVAGLSAAGVAAVPVSSRATAAELAYVGGDVDARVVFVDSELEEPARAAGLDARVIVFGAEYEELVTRARPSPLEAVPDTDTFCIPYTAGTTGRPKGVLLPHRSRVLTMLLKAIEYGSWGPGCRGLAVAPLFHGAGFANAVGVVYLGGSVLLTRSFDAEETVRLLAERRITDVAMVPTQLQALLEVTGSYDTRALRTIVSMGAALPEAVKERLIARFGEGLLHEGYGTTEASIVSNLRPADQLRKTRSAGRAYPTVHLRVVDETGEQVPDGEVGELYVRSPLLFNGYWRRPVETAAALHDGWCATGDLVRRDEEGYLFIVDRKGDKIISGGIDISPREIEEALLRHPAVREAVVYGVPDERWGEAVRAAVVLRSRVSADELLRSCSTELARYKLPKAVDFVDALPRSAAGKTPRRALREAFIAG